MKLTGPQIKRLRLRMGWTICDLARRMAVTRACVVSWERDLTEPDEESCRQLHRIQGLLEQQMEKLRTQPLADRILTENNWDQVAHEEVSSEEFSWEQGV